MSSSGEYSVTHLDNGRVEKHPYIFLNPHLKEPAKSPGHTTSNAAVEAFHHQLPHYGETTLHSLPDIAKELGFAHVFLKDESTRFGLPAFKILGASWAIYRAVCRRLDIEADPAVNTLDKLREAVKKAKADESTDNGAKGKSLRLVTCSEGNWGRACARMSSYLELACTLHVPGYMNIATQDLIRGEGAEVHVVTSGPGGGSYDDAIAATVADAQETGALLVLDTSWEGYEEVPAWVTEGYGTMLAETDRQVAAATATAENGKGTDVGLAICSVGVGSWAHAVVAHYHTSASSSSQIGACKIATVEPWTAASLKESLHNSVITPIQTGDTIMCGMNCGTTSKIAWPVLRDGTYAAVAVTDSESHTDVQYLQSRGANAGPCGAATLSALKRLCKESDLVPLADRAGTAVVLFSTEGMREYEAPT